jgi:hypothetical protein
MRGHFGVDDTARRIFEEEYVKFEDNSMAANPALSGYVGRRHINLLKVSMVMSASRTSNREIIGEDMARAVKIMQSAEAGMPMVLRTITSEPVGDLTEYLMTTIMSAGTISRGDLLRAVRHRLTAQGMDVLLAGILESKTVVAKQQGEEVMYKYVGIKK